MNPDSNFIVDKNTSIEDLLEKIPAAQRYLSEKGIRCVICGEAIWGNLGDAAKEKGFDDVALAQFVRDLNALEQA